MYALVLDLCFFERRSVRLLLILMQMVWDPLEAASWANLETSDPGNRLTPTMTRVPTLVQAGAGGNRHHRAAYHHHHRQHRHHGTHAPYLALCHAPP